MQLTLCHLLSLLKTLVLGDKVDATLDIVKDVTGSEKVGEVEGLDGEDAEADETDMGDARAGCWVLWASWVGVRVQASGVCARFTWCPVCVQVPVVWAVSCMARGGVVELSWMRGLVGYPGGVDICSMMCGSDCWRQWWVQKKAP